MFSDKAIINLINIKFTPEMSRIFFIFPVIIFVICFLSCNNSSSDIKEQDVELEKKIESLLSQMTLKEKIGQMNQSFVESEDLEIINNIRKGKVGSVLNVAGTQNVNLLQRIAVEESRLGIPLLVSREVIHGFKTIFPIPLGQAATFNPELVKECAEMASIETSAAGIRMTFAPMLDICRDPRWGRIAESFGEDPFLAGEMGRATILGFQGDDLSAETSVATCAKHFIGYGAVEGGKDYNSTSIPPFLLKNIYLYPFEKAIEAGTSVIMTSFNDNDGIPSSANEYLLKQLLRNELKFDGFVISDWNAIPEMIIQGYCPDKKEASMMAVNAGVDMEMASGTFLENLEELVSEGKVSEASIDEAVRNVLRIKFRLGLFDNPYADSSRISVLYANEHLLKAKEIAEQSIVLLKNNNGLLPFNETLKTLAVIGPMANAPHDQLGTWVFDGEKEKTVTPLKALQESYGDKVNITYSEGLSFSRQTDKSGFAEAVRIAGKADAVLVIVGEEAILSGEAHSLSKLNLVGAQKELISELKKTGKPLITIVMAGRPLTIGDELNASDAFLYAFHPGTMGGPAIADILFGKVNPSGRLPVSFPHETGQIPVYYNHNNTGRPATGKEMRLNDIPLEANQNSVGNRSYYLDSGSKPLLPFGYGLSYTTFNYDNLVLDQFKIKEGDTLKISIDLENTGKYRGTEVVQLYIRDMAGSIIRPVKELKDFKRITLDPGAIETVNFTLTTEQLSFWGKDNQRKAEPGAFSLWVGSHSHHGLQSRFILE